MTNRLVILTWTILVVGSQIPSLRAADPAEELRFAQALRAERYYDLAEQQLTRMQKMNFPPSVANEIESERLNILLDKAGDEPDTAKRVARYDEVRILFAEKAKSPNPKEAAAARLSLANVTRAQARIQLSIALARRGQERDKEGEKARELLGQTQKQLEEVLKDMEEQAKKATDPRDKAHLEDSARQIRFDLALNILEQAITIVDDGKTATRKMRSDKVELAKKAFTVIANVPTTSSQTWLAKAWLVRCANELGESDNVVTALIDAVLNSKEPAAAEGKRVALYFRILRDKEKATDKIKAVDEGTRDWLKDYARFKNTPEGFGVRFLRAEVLVQLAQKAGVRPTDKEKYLADARTLLSDLESTDNEYTERAINYKLGIMEMQRAFEKKVSDLATFDDCFQRARYELYRVDVEFKELDTLAKDKEKKDEEKVKARQEFLKNREKHYLAALEAMERGLGLPEVTPDNLRKIPHMAGHVGVARASLPYYYLMLGNMRAAEKDYVQANKFYRHAIRTGDDFITKNPEAPEVELCVQHIFDAYRRLIDRDGTDEDRAKFVIFVDFVEKKWPKGDLANLARLRHAELLLAANNEKAVENNKLAIQILSRITPDYIAYEYAQSRLIYTCEKADKEGYKPIKLTPDGPEIPYRQIIIEALRRIPEPKGDDPGANRRFIDHRDRLINQYYKDGQAALVQGQAALKEAATLTGDDQKKKQAEASTKFAEAVKQLTAVDTQASALKKRLGELEFGLAEDANAKKAENEKFRTYWTGTMELWSLGAAIGVAEAEMAEGKFAAAATRLDPIVDLIKADTNPALRKNADMTTRTLGISLRANVQAAKPQRVQVAVLALVDSETRKIIAMTPDANKEQARAQAVNAVLRQLIGLVKAQTAEMKEHNNEAGLAAFRKGMADVFASLEQMVPNPTNETYYRYAEAWGELGNQAKAIPYLDKITEPKADAPAEEIRLYRRSQILYIRLLREAKNFPKANELIVKAYGPAANPKDPKDKGGWGRSDLDIHKEELWLAYDEGRYADGLSKGKGMLPQLFQKATAPGGADMQKHYLEVYYVVIACIVKHSHKLPDPKDQAKETTDAATHLLRIETSFPDYGGGESAKRFTDLLAAEPALKAELGRLRAAAPKVPPPAPQPKPAP